MHATGFDEENGVLDRPAGMTADGCDPLSVFRGHVGKLPVVISCWKVTAEELDEINRTGRVWLYVYGHTMQPVSMSGTHPFD